MDKNYKTTIQSENNEYILFFGPMLNEETYKLFQFLVKIIIISNLHYSLKEQFYLNTLIKSAKLSGMHGDEKIHNWLRSFCDSDKDEVLQDLLSNLKEEEELHNKIRSEKDFKKQEKLLKSAIKKYPNSWSFQNDYSGFFQCHQIGIPICP